MAELGEVERGVVQSLFDRVSPEKGFCGILWVVGGRSDEEIYEKYADALIRFATGLGAGDAADVVSSAKAVPQR